MNIERENTMTRDALTTRLSNLSDDETRCELSDWAVNTLRELARDGKITKGPGLATVADLPVLVAGEAARIRAAGIALDATGLVPGSVPSDPPRRFPLPPVSERPSGGVRGHRRPRVTSGLRGQRTPPLPAGFSRFRVSNQGDSSS
jgi:hypothetical protein